MTAHECLLSTVHEPNEQDTEDESETTRYDVIAVHGLGGDSETSWTVNSQGTEVAWLRELLPKALGNARVMAFSYKLKDDDGISRDTISNVARALVEAVAEKRSQSQPSRSIIFIASGIGGIIIKKALMISLFNKNYAPIAAQTSLLVFFETPHRAKNVISWESITSRLLMSGEKTFHARLSEVLKTSSETLIEVCNEFDYICRVFTCFDILREGAHESSHAGIETWLLEVSQERVYLNRLAFADASEQAFQKLCKRIMDSSEPDTQYIDCLSDFSTVQLKHDLPFDPVPNPALFQLIQRQTQEIFNDWVEERGSPILQLLGERNLYTSRLLASHIAGGLPTGFQVIGFTFHSRGIRQRSAIEMLISLTFQLLCRRPWLFDHVRALYETMSVEPKWRIESLFSLFRSLISCPDQGPVCCLVESFDECDPSSQFLVDRFVRRQAASPSRLKVLVTSAIPLDDSANSMTINLGSLTICQEDMVSIVKADVADFVTQRPKYRTFEDVLVQRLANLQRPSVALVNAGLSLSLLAISHTPSSYSSTLAEIEGLPQSRDAIYERFLEAIPGSHVQWARKVLSWMCRASRPLRLSELAVAVTIEPQTQPLSEMEKLIPIDLPGDLRHAFGTLIEIRKDEVIFIHESFISFFVSKCATGQAESPLFCIYDDATIFEACIEYLSAFQDCDSAKILAILKDDSTYTDSSPENTRAYGLLAYAVDHWPHHCKAASRGVDRKYFANKDLMNRWAELYWHLDTTVIRQPSSPRHPLSAAVRAGCVVLVESLIEQAEIDSSDYSGALEVALELGDKTLVDLLLPRSEGIQCLQIAASRGHEALVQAFLRDLQSVEDKDLTGRTALHHASKGGWLAVIKVLLAAGSDVDATDDQWLTPLHLASQFGHSDAMQVLLEAGATVDSADINNNTSLHFVSSGQHPQAMDVLLTHKAQVHKQQDDGLTPLHLAAREGRVDLATKLLESCSPLEKDGLLESQDDRGSTPLHIAAAKGYAKVVEALLRQGNHSLNQLRIENHANRVPLHMATQNGHLSIVKILLAESADEIKSRTSTDSHPIHLAVSNENPDIVEELCLSHQRQEYSLDIFDFFARSPLHLASKMGNTQIVDILIRFGAQVDIAGGSGETPLFLACEGGHVETVTHLLQSGADPRSTDSEGRLPLHIACEIGNHRLAKVLLGHTPNLPLCLSSTDNVGRIPAHLAAAGSELELFQDLVTLDIDLDVCDENGRGLLHFAAQGGNLGIFKYLLDIFSDTEGQWRRGGHERDLSPAASDDLSEHAMPSPSAGQHMIDQPDSQGRTPLLVAAKYGNLDIIRLLLEIPTVDLDKQDDLKRTPLSYLAERGALDIVRTLLERNANCDSHDDDGQTPLWYAAKEGHDDVVQELLNWNAATNIKDDVGRTVLHMAASEGRTSIVQILLNSGRDLDGNSRDNEGRTPLFKAAYHGRSEVLRLLLAHGFKADIRDNLGWSALHAAFDHLPTIRELLKFDCDVNEVNNDGSTPLHMAISSQYLDVATELLDHKADPLIKDGDGSTSLHAAAGIKDVEFFRIVLAHTAGFVDVQDKYGTTPLHKAISDGDLDVVKELLEYQADTLLEDSNGRTSLHVAARKSQKEFVHMVLEYTSGSVDVQDGLGETPLHLAIFDGNLDVVKELLGHKSNPLVTSMAGRTALHVAAQWSDDEFVRTVLEHTEGTVNVQDNDGDTPLHLAAVLGHLHGVEALLERDDINILLTNKKNQTAIWTAIANNHGDVVEALLERVDINALPERPEDIFLLVINTMETKNLEFWISKGLHFDPNDEDLFQAAVAKDDAFLAEVLLRQGADENRTDKHGWNLKARVAVTEPGRLVGMKNELSELEFVSPTAWDPNMKATCISLEDPTTVSLDASVRRHHMSSYLRRRANIVGSILANHPIPPLKPLYFEVTVVRGEDEGAIAIGFGQSRCSLDMLPGWEDCSWAYHSDDGMIYYNDTSMHTSETYGTDNVIGCCIDPVNGTAYFTKDQKRIDYTLRGISGRLFPMVGFQNAHGTAVQVNFRGDPDTLAVSEDKMNVEEGVVT